MMCFILFRVILFFDKEHVPLKQPIIYPFMLFQVMVLFDNEHFLYNNTPSVSMRFPFMVLFDSETMLQYIIFPMLFREMLLFDIKQIDFKLFRVMRLFDNEHSPPLQSIIS